MRGSRRVFEEREFINIADGETMRTIEIGNAARSVDVALVVIGRVKGGIPRRGSVDVFGKGVCSLQIVPSPAARECGLQRMIDGISVVGEELISAVAV